MASRGFQIIPNFFSSQTSSETHHLLPADAVTIPNRHQNKLGDGSFAKVYRGQYRSMPCAVKVFNEDSLKKDLSNPEHEFELAYLHGTNHANIVQMYGLWIDPHKGRNVTSIVMELCKETLLQHIQRMRGKSTSIDSKLQILMDICKGMTFLHNGSIVHGDLRPPNILLVENEDKLIAKVSDFGMSRYIDPQKHSHLTDTHTDEDYLPPEVFDEKHQRTPKQKFALLTFSVDIFCFGLVALQLACGEFPTPLKKVDRFSLRAPPKVRTEVERRARHLIKIKHSDKEVLEPNIRSCLADKSEDRPSFTDLYAIFEAKQKRYREQPDLQMLKDKILEVEQLRAMESKWKIGIDEMERLTQVLESKQSVIEAKEELLRELDDEVKKLHKDMAMLEAGKEEKCKDIERLMSELQDEKKNNEVKAQQLGGKEYENEQLKLGQKQLLEKERSLNEELKKANEAIDGVHHELDQVKTEHQRQMERLRKDLEERESALQELNDKVLQGKEELEGVKTELSATKERWQSLNAALAEAKQEGDDLRQSLQIAHDAIAKKAESSTSTMKELCTAKARVEQQDKHIQDLESEKESLQDNVSQLNNLIVEQNHKLLENAKELEKSKNQIEEKDLEIAELKSAEENLNAQLTDVNQQQKQRLEEEQKQNSEIERLNGEAKSHLEAMRELQSENSALNADLESAKAECTRKEEKLKRDLTDVKVSLETMTSNYSKEVTALKIQLNQRHSSAEDQISSLMARAQAAEEKAAQVDRKSEVISIISAKLRDLEGQLAQAKLDNAALQWGHQKALTQCQEALAEATDHANRCQGEKNNLWREKEETEIACVKEKEGLKASHKTELLDKENACAREIQMLKSRHENEWVSMKQEIEQLQAALEGMESTATQPTPHAKKAKGRKDPSFTDTQSALQDAKQRAISLLKEKSDWMKQKREWEKEQTTLAETKRKLVTAKEKIQTCEEETKKLHTEKSDLIDKYQGLLQQQKAWQSAIADCNAAKDAKVQAQSEKDRLIQEHKDLQNSHDKLNKRYRVILNERSQLMTKLQMNMSNGASELSSELDWKDEEKDKEIPEREVLRKQNEHLQSQLRELRAHLSELVKKRISEDLEMLSEQCHIRMTAMNSRLEQVAAFLPTFKQKCNSVASQMERLKDYSELKELLQKQTTSLVDECKQKKEELKESVDRVDFAMVQLRDVTEERDRLKLAVADEHKWNVLYKESAQALQDELQKCKKERNLQREHIAAYRALVNEISMEAEALDTKCTELEQKHASAQCAMHELQEQVSRVTQEKLQISSEKDVLHGAKEAHESTIRELVSKVQNVEENRKVASEELDNFKALHQQVELQLSNAKRQLLEHSCESEALQSANKELKDRLDDIQSKLCQTDEGLSAQQAKTEMLQKECTRVQEELECKTSQLKAVEEEKVDGERKALKMAQKQQLSWQRKTDEINADKKALRSQVEALEKTVSQLQNELMPLRAASEDLQKVQLSLSCAEDQRTKLEASLVALNGTLTTKTQECTALQKQVQEAQHQLEVANSDLERRKIAHNATEEMLRAIEGSLKATEKRLKARNDDYIELEDGQIKLQDDYRAQTEVLQDTKAKYTHLTAEYEKTKEELLTLESEITSLSNAFQKKTDLCVQLEEDNRKMAASRSEIKQLKRDCRQTKACLQRALQEVEVERAKFRGREDILQGIQAGVKEQVKESTSGAVKEHLQQLHEDSEKQMQAMEKKLEERQTFLKQMEKDHRHQLQSQVQEMREAEHTMMDDMAKQMMSICESRKDAFQTELQVHTDRKQKRFIKEMEVRVQAELSKVEQRLPQKPVIPTAKDLLMFHNLANSCNPCYLHSHGSECVLLEEDLGSLCDSQSIKCVYIGEAEQLLMEEEICIPKVVRDFVVGAIESLVKKPRVHFCCTVPYITYTKDVSLYNLLISQNTAAYNADSRIIFTELEVALTRVTLLPQLLKKLRLQRAFDGTAFCPYWSGKEPGEEATWAQAIQKVNRLPDGLCNLFKVLNAERAKEIRAGLEKHLSWV